MQMLMNVERIFQSPEGKLCLVARQELVELREPGMIPDDECVHYGSMPESVKAALLDPIPLFLRNRGCN